MLDVYDYCSDDLKGSLKHGWDFEIKQRIEEDEKILSGKLIEEETKEVIVKKDKQKVELINDAHLY